MRKTLLFLLLALPLSAQIPSGFVQTTGTVSALANGTFGAAWTNLSFSSQLPLLGCVSTFQQTVNGNLDGSGHFSVLLADTAQICPTPSTWTFTFTYNCPPTNTGFMVAVPVTGGDGTKDITAQITAALPTNPCSNGGGGGGGSGQFVSKVTTLPQSILSSLSTPVGFLTTNQTAANASLNSFDAYANLQYGYAILGDSTWVISNAFGATVDANTVGYKVANALNMPLSQNYALAGAECSDAFPLMITPNSLNPGPGYGTIPDGQGWTTFTFGINDSLNLGVSSNAENFYTSACTAAAEWMGVARINKTMATDPVTALAGGFASSFAIVNGGAISTSNGASATFPITTVGNKLHILYGAYEQGVVQSATYVSGGSVTGVAGQGCFVGSFNNSSTANATVVLTGTNTLASASITFNISHGTGATAPPTTAVLTNGSATCSGTITISSVLSPGGAVGATVGAATVTIDGSSVAGLTAQAPGGFIFTSILGTTSTMLDQAYTVAAGAHTIVVTTTNTGTFTIGGVLSQGTNGTNPPAVAYGGVLHQNLCTSDSTTGAYDVLNQAIATSLRADGIIAPFVDYRTAVSCGTAGTIPNSGMNGATTAMPDGTTCPASTSPGSHPNDCGYETAAQKFRITILPLTQNAGSTSLSFSTNQGTGGQTVTANYDLQSFWRWTTNLNVNSGAWPIQSFYNHNGTGTVAGAFQYYDSSLGQFVLGDNGTLAVSTIGAESTFNKRFAFRNSGQLFTLTPTGGAAATLNVPSLGSTEAVQLQEAGILNNQTAGTTATVTNTLPTITVASTTGIANGNIITGAGIPLGTTVLSVVGSVVTMSANATVSGTLVAVAFFGPTITANTAFNLMESAGFGQNVTTTNLVNSYLVQGGTTSTWYSCQPSSGGPFTVAAPSDAVASGPFGWPLATTGNINTAASTCYMFDLIRLDTNGGTNSSKWVMKPYANLQFANTFAVQQTMPTLKLTGSGCGSATAYPNSDGSGCSVPGAGAVNVTLTTTASVTISGTSGYYYNQDATAAAAITYTLPTPAAGLQFCVKNSNNGSAANTGTLEILVANTGAQAVIYNGAVSASGFIQSSGAAGDSACVIGISTTKWEAYPSVGIWVLH